MTVTVTNDSFTKIDVTEKNINVAIIIVNWNYFQLTIFCLKSLQKIKTKNFKVTIYLLDNGSTNNSVNELSNFIKKYPLNIQFVQSKINLGFSKGNNLLIKKAIENKFDYVCLLNNDTRVETDFLTILISAAESHPGVAGAGGKIYFERSFEPKSCIASNRKNLPIIWYAGGPLKLTEIYPENRGYGEIDTGKFNRQEETQFISGCLFLIKTSVLEKVGLLDERYYHSYEDVDLSLRINAAGYKLLYCPKSVIWHLGSASSGRETDFINYFTDRNAWLYVSKWSPWRTKLSLVIDFARIMAKGSYWEKMAVVDFLRKNFGQGSWPNQ